MRALKRIHSAIVVDGPVCSEYMALIYSAYLRAVYMQYGIYMHFDGYVKSGVGGSFSLPEAGLRTPSRT
jgi:hypothetical protein